MTDLSLRMNDGTQIIVPASLNSITTFILLEQERWFEKETQFLARWLRPGMNAIDIGANLGVYSLPMARLIGPHSKVFAYEPASKARRLLELSGQKNHASNLHIVAAALSDTVRDGHLVFGASSELNTLAGTGDGETVKITTLDAENAARQFPSIDFLKIDAESEAERILAGASSFFKDESPLVLFEIKPAGDQNESLRAAFTKLGFGIYRQVGYVPVLVPVKADETLDVYERNLFAAKPDRAAKLAAEGLLTQTITPWKPSGDARAQGLAALQAQPFSPAIAHLLADEVPVGPEYADVLAAYAAWRSEDLPLAERCGALDYACTKLTALCEKEASLARFSTLARIAYEAGRRNISVISLNYSTEMLKQRNGRVFEPFWPANPRFDKLDFSANPVEWFVMAVLEQFERTAHHSSGFGTSGVDMGLLGAHPLASTEILRRIVLLRARDLQEPTEVPAKLLEASDDHLNADIWKAGLVPNTLVRQ